MLCDYTSSRSFRMQILLFHVIRRLRADLQIRSVISKPNICGNGTAELASVRKGEMGWNILQFPRLETSGKF